MHERLRPRNLLEGGSEVSVSEWMRSNLDVLGALRFVWRLFTEAWGYASQTDSGCKLDKNPCPRAVRFLESAPGHSQRNKQTLVRGGGRVLG